MALKFFWRAEGTTLDGTHDYSAGDTTATANGAVAISNAGAIVGSNGVRVTGGGQNYRFDNAGIGSGQAAVGSMAFLFRHTGTPSGLAVFGINLRGANANDYVQTRISGAFGSNAGQVRAYFRSTDAGGTETNITGTANLSQDTTYGVVVRYDQPGSRRRLEVYNADGSLRYGIDNTTPFVAPIGFSSSTGLRIGEDSGFTVTGSIDNVFIADAYDEPLQDKLFITSYTEYGGATPSVTDVDTDETITSSQTNVVVTGTNFGASQGTGSVTLRNATKSATQSIDSWSATSIQYDVSQGDIQYGSRTLRVTANGGAYGELAVTLTPPAGRAYVDIGTPATSGVRLTATPDLASGDQVEWGSVVGGAIGDVVVAADGTFTAASGVTAFDVRVWDSSDSTWGSWATQTVSGAGGTSSSRGLLRTLTRNLSRAVLRVLR